MISSSVGSDVFAAFALIVISALVLSLLRHYLPLRTTPSYLLTPVFLALALPCSIILLVPIDLASSSGTDTDGNRGIWLPDRLILVSWRITYWLTFMLTWFILPLLGEYSDSGYREPKDRFVYSLRTNGRYQLIVLSVSIVGAIYFFLQGGFRGQSLKALVMALAYAWGLIMAVYLMGHGLVALPRKLFRNASVSGRLRRLQSHAPMIYDKMEEAIEELGSVETQVSQLYQRKSTLGPDLRDWIEELAEASNKQGPQAGGSSSAGNGIPPVVTDRYMAEVARKLKRARHKKARFVDEWKNLVQQAADLQAVLDASSSRQLDFGHRSGIRLSFMTPTLRYHIHAHLIPAARVATGTVLALASVGLIWSEIVHIFEGGSKLSLIGLTVVHHPGSSRGEIGFGGQLVASAWLLYMCTAALYSMSEIKVWGNRALVKRQTYGESACWYSLQVAKLTVPLSFNFITMLQPTIYKETQFYQFLGKLINLTPLGEGFSRYFPIFVLLPVCATLFNLYGKIKNVLGFGVLDDESEDNAIGGWRDGQTLIGRELQSDGSRVGLTPTYHDSSARSSLDNRGRPESRASLLPVTNNARRADPRQDIANEELDDSGRYFFQDLGERVKNTFETADRPQWLRELGSTFKKPKWMNNDSGGGPSWFGGGNGSSSGGVRL